MLIDRLRGMSATGGAPALDAELPGLEHDPVELRRGPHVPLDDELPSILEDNDDTSGKGRIRCPICGWQPRSGDLWSCRCGGAWNTFDTGGRCPDCGRQWLKTQCLLCGQWSKHDDWYE